MPVDIKVGEIVTLKKNHACGCNTWEVLRTGADFKIKCTQCEHLIMIPRSKFEKYLKNKH